MSILTVGLPASQPSIPQAAPCPPPVDQIAKLNLSDLIKQTADIKTGLKAKALSDRVRPGSTAASEAVMISGDLLTSVSLFSTGLLIQVPSLTKISAIKMTSLVFGVLGGIINAIVGLICIRAGIQALKKGDKLSALRLLVLGVLFVGIGVIMSFLSFGFKAGIAGAMTAFFATHPWLLPVLFLIAGLPTACEVSLRLLKKSELAANLKNKGFAEMLQLIEKEDSASPLHLGSLRAKSNETEIRQELSKKMEDIEQEKGVEAAIEIFHLLYILQKTYEENGRADSIEKRAEYEVQREKVQSKIKNWNFIQRVRAIQQIFAALAFGLSMGVLGCRLLNTRLIKAGQSFAMALANLLPFLMDLFSPLARNVSMMIPPVIEAK